MRLFTFLHQGSYRLEIKDLANGFTHLLHDYSDAAWSFRAAP
jgi:hypothetical protein